MANTQGMAEHHAAITVNAPLHQVYGLFTHFNDFPKFMSFVKEVTYYDEQRSHWVAEVVGRHEWDAVNDSWVEDRQVGWHSTNGLENYGRVIFQPTGANQTQVDVYINYDPPAGVLGDIGENLGVGSRFDSVLQHDMDNFARMVDQAPPGALDPTSSNYLFHSGSAAAKGTTTSRQDETMNRDRDQMSYSSNAGAAYSDPTMNPNNQNYGTNPGYANPMPNPMQNPNSPTYGTNAGTGYADPTMNPNNQGYGTGATPNTGYNDSTGQAYGASTGYTDPTMNPTNQRYGTNPGYTDPTMNPNNPTNQGYGTNPGYTDPTMNPNNQSYGTNPGAGSTDPAMRPNRPILDQDIINENTGNTPKTPNSSGTQGDVMPPESGTRNPVMPPD